MKIEFDQFKNERNIRKRGIAFSLAQEFDFETTIRFGDNRKDYGEVRINAVGYIGERLHVLCFKPLKDDTFRVISPRKANERERKKYQKIKQIH